LWISARRSALDLARARRREREVLADLEVEPRATVAGPDLDEMEAQRAVEEFRSGPLPKRWARVFEARFLRGLSQREAAAELGMRRTTLAYQELRIRHLLRRFVLARERR